MSSRGEFSECWLDEVGVGVSAVDEYAEGVWRHPRPLTGLNPEIFAARTQLGNEARQLGFKQLRITGKRHIKSTSKNPGKEIDITIELSKQCMGHCQMENVMPTHIKEFEEAKDHGKTPDELLFLMHQQGLTIIEAIKAFMRIYKVPLGEAKERVSDSPFWQKIVMAAEPLHDQLEESFNPASKNCE